MSFENVTPSIDIGNAAADDKPFPEPLMIQFNDANIT